MILPWKETWENLVQILDEDNPGDQKIMDQETMVQILIMIKSQILIHIMITNRIINMIMLSTKTKINRF